MSCSAEEGQLIVRNFIGLNSNDGIPPLVDYHQAWVAMKDFTRKRDKQTPDELWFMEHPPVFTLGQAADKSHVLDAGDIPLLKVDRGGQVTYHGPGQIMCYLMADLSRLGISVRSLVESLERVVIQVLDRYGITSHGDRKAPGIYVDNRKIAALGLRVSRSCTYHGLCFNFDFDASPFKRINPCGFTDLEVTQLSEWVNIIPEKNKFIGVLVTELVKILNYREITQTNTLWGE